MPCFLRRCRFAGLFVLGMAACAEQPAPDQRPNILLIVADDLGYADLGVSGSDIRTPNIDSLAGKGILFTQFHTAPYCAPTRAMLLSGNNNHVAGMGLQWASGTVRGHLPGYERHLSDRTAHLPRLLREAGYHTYMTGKWHLGTAEKHSPKAAGFDRSFGVVGGAASHFSSSGFYEGGSLYREDGKEVAYPDGAYTTELYTDRLVEYIESNRGDGRPFFAYAAYTSPHWPLQVPEDELDRYRGQYDAGYDVLRDLRFASLIGADIIPESSSLPPRNDAITPWDNLTPDERRREARKMELYAAMVENLDHHVGRLLAYLHSNDLYDNTLIVWMSDNGAAAEDFYNDEYEGYADYVRAHYDNAYENMGSPTSWVSYGPQWAEAGSAPFSRYKGYTTEGGIVAPLIVSGAGVTGSREINRSYVTVMDIAPTLLELAESSYPDDEWLAPIAGESMLGLLAGRDSTVHDNDYVTTLYHAGRAFIRQGRWKLVTWEPPFDESKFQLFDIETDPGETTDLSATNPGKRAEMIELWRAERQELGIILPDDI